MNFYTLKGCVDIHDVDYNGIAKTSAVLKYIQSAAQAQLNDNGMSYDQLKERSRAFLLSRLKMEILKPLRAYTPITAITYPCESRGFSFLRCYELRCENETVARAMSVWALIDTDTRALVKVNDFDLGLPTLPPNDLILGAMKLPSTLIDVGGYCVHYGDVDQNRHMNNTKYPDMYSSFLPLSNRMIHSLEINYSAEAEIGDKLRVQRAEEGGYFYFRTLRSDGRVNSEARITLREL